MFKSIGRRTAVAAVIIGAAAAVGSVAWAAIPAANGVISGCYEKRLGILRVIDAEAGKACTQYELPISWNREGPKGERGPQGESGKLALAGESCAAGEFATGFDAAGDLMCSPPPGANPTIAAALSPAGLNFGTVEVGGGKSLDVQVTNVSGSVLQMTPVQISHVPEFRVGSLGCSEVSPGATCSFGVVFRPTAPSPYVATFMIAGVELTVTGVGAVS